MPLGSKPVTVGATSFISLFSEIIFFYAFYPVSENSCFIHFPSLLQESFSSNSYSNVVIGENYPSLVDSRWSEFFLLFLPLRKEKVLVTQSCLILSDPMECDPRLPLFMEFSWQNSGVSCHFLLQEIFPTQGSNISLLHCRQILYHLSH